MEIKTASLNVGSTRSSGNGKPLYCSCLGNSMDRGAWQATVHGVAKELNMTWATKLPTTALPIPVELLRFSLKGRYFFKTVNVNPAVCGVSSPSVQSRVTQTHRLLLSLSLCCLEFPLLAQRPLVTFSRPYLAPLSDFMDNGNQKKPEPRPQAFYFWKLTEAMNYISDFLHRATGFIFHYLASTSQ